MATSTFEATLAPLVEKVLRDLFVPGVVTKLVGHGPVRHFMYQPNPGISLNRVRVLARDIERQLGVTALTIEQSGFGSLAEIRFELVG